jgi:hypothetical protein
MDKYHGFKIGDKIRVKISEPAYDLQTVLLSDVGIIKRFAPKVRICKGETLDNLPYFAYCEFNRIVNPIHNNRLRGGIDICNLVKINPLKIMAIYDNE